MTNQSQHLALRAWDQLLIMQYKWVLSSVVFVLLYVLSIVEFVYHGFCHLMECNSHLGVICNCNSSRYYFTNYIRSYLCGERPSPIKGLPFLQAIVKKFLNYTYRPRNTDIRDTMSCFPNKFLKFPPLYIKISFLFPQLVPSLVLINRYQNLEIGLLS